MQRPSKSYRGGFTLVELLVVILIMTILLTIGAAGFRNAGGKGVSTALPSAEAIFEEARSIAEGKGTFARVLIDVADVDSEANYLRRMVVAYADVEDNGAVKDPIEWVLASKAYLFPPKTYFSQEYSKKNHKSGSGNLDVGKFDFDGNLYDGEFLYYEFNSEGICTTGLGASGDYNAPSFVIGNGARGRGEENPRTTGDGRRDFGGFVIWRNGATSVFRNPSQIFGSAEPKTF